MNGSSPERQVGTEFIRFAVSVTVLEGKDMFALSQPSGYSTQ